MIRIIIMSDGIMVFVSFYEYWHWIVAGFLSPNLPPMIANGVVLCRPVMSTSHLT